MSQQDLIEVISTHPGILQEQLPKITGISINSIGDAMKRLEKWGKVRRVRVGKTFACFLVV